MAKGFNKTSVLDRFSMFFGDLPNLLTNPIYEFAVLAMKLGIGIA